MKASFMHEMRKKKIKNLSELSYQSKIPYRDLDFVIGGELRDKGFRILDKLKDFFRCRLDRLLTANDQIWTFNGNAYDPISGVVYFIKNKQTGLIKIGYTKDLLSRVTNLSYEYKAEMEVLHYVATYDADTLEKTFHMFFADKRIDKEWFNLTDEDFQRIKGSDAPTPDAK